jgi:hypothetical protein
LATAAAFAITEHLKLIKSPIYGPVVTKLFSPVCRCATDKAAISFKLRQRDTVTVSVVNSSGTVIDTVNSGVTVPKGKTRTFYWDGRYFDGSFAPEGKYEPQVDLKNARRTIRMPNTIVVDRTPPKVLSATDGDGILTTGGGHSIAIEYAFSDKAHADVSLDGRRVVLGHPTRTHNTVKWNGRVGGKTLPPGRYVLDVGAIDLAGNESLPADQRHVVVHILAIALPAEPIHVRPGASFTVKVRTGAPQYAWTFAGKQGTATKLSLQLRAPAKRGRYRLVVSARGYTATETVFVGRK